MWLTEHGKWVKNKRAVAGRDTFHFPALRIILGGRFCTGCLTHYTLTQYCACSKSLLFCVAFGASDLQTCHAF